MPFKCSYSRFQFFPSLALPPVDTLSSGRVPSPPPFFLPYSAYSPRNLTVCHHPCFNNPITSVFFLGPPSSTKPIQSYLHASRPCSLWSSEQNLEPEISPAHNLRTNGRQTGNLKPICLATIVENSPTPARKTAQIPRPLPQGISRILAPPKP